MTPDPERRPASRPGRTVVAVLALLVLASVALAALPASGAGSVVSQATAAGNATVELAPANASVAPNETATFEVRVADADGRVAAYDVAIELADPDVASITGIEPAGDPGISNATIAPDNASAAVVAALANASRTGPTTIASVTVAGVEPGTTRLSLSVPALGNASGAPYRVAGTDGASLVVEDAGATGTPPATAADSTTAGSATTTGSGPGFGVATVLGGFLAVFALSRRG
jgi:hypothetical protein